MVSLTNPKVILFFMAVLPQFVGTASNVTLQLAMLSVINVAMEVVLYGTIGALAGTLGSRFADSRRSSTVLHLVAAAVYAALGIMSIGGVVLRLVDA